MGRTLQTLRFLRLTDECGRISLTNLAVYLGFYCMIRGIQVQWTALCAFLVGMLSYHTRTALDNDNPSEEHVQRVADLEAKVQKLASPERLAQIADAFKTRGPGALR
jgi:hypothetical protein